MASYIAINRDTYRNIHKIYCRIKGYKLFEEADYRFGRSSYEQR